MAPRPVHGLSLCTGAGGLELGLRLAVPGYRMVGAVERDAYAAACLVARMEDQTLDQAPVWDDITTFDPGPWRSRVDLVSAGFPCQPLSSAGFRRGKADERWLWPDVARVVRGVEPGLVFLENVPELIVHGLDDVLGDLASRGFDAEWEVLSASDVGATQRRKRTWVLAYRDRERLAQLWREPGHDGDAWGDVDGPCGQALADTLRVGRTTRVRPATGPQTGTVVRSVRRKLGTFPPGPDDHDGWEQWISEGGPQPLCSSRC